MSWPPPRLPPRPSTPAPEAHASSELALPPQAPESALDPLIAAGAGSRTPSGELRLSQLREVLFGDSQRRFEHRLNAVEAQIGVLQAEARARFGLMESSLANELGDAIGALTNKVNTREAEERAENEIFEQRLASSEEGLSARLAMIESEVRTIRGDVEALTEGLRVEAMSMGNHIAEVLRGELEGMVEARMRDLLSRSFQELAGALCGPGATRAPSSTPSKASGNGAKAGTSSPRGTGGHTATAAGNGGLPPGASNGASAPAASGGATNAHAASPPLASANGRPGLVVTRSAPTAAELKRWVSAVAGADRGSTGGGSG